MKNITITGSSGFVGVNLVNYLTNCNVKRLNLRNLTEMSIGVNQFAVIHLAGKAHDLSKTKNSDEYYQVNFELTKKLYNAFLKSKSQKFIFISSVKAAADVVSGVLTESHLAAPKSHYGKSKLMAEEFIQQQVLPAGKSFYILRPCMIHGVGNKGNLNLLYQFVKKGIPYPLAAFNNQRSFLSVDNLCYVIQHFIENEVPSGIYNVSDDEPLSTNEVVSVLAKSRNTTPRLWAIPIPVVKIIANLGSLIGLPLNKERLNKLTENYIVSNDKLKKTLNIELPLSSKEGLMLTAKSFKKI